MEYETEMIGDPIESHDAGRDLGQAEMTPEQEAQFLISVLCGEVQNASDFIKIHATAAFVKQRYELAKQEYDKARKLRDAWQSFLSVVSHPMLTLLAQHGEVTSTGFKVKTPYGTSYTRTTKEDSCVILDEAAAIEWMKANYEAPRELVAQGLVVLVPKLTDAGKAAIKSDALKSFRECGEILTHNGVEIVRVTPAGNPSVVVRTAKIDRSAATIAQRLLPRGGNPNTQHDEDFDDGE